MTLKRNAERLTERVTERGDKLSRTEEREVRKGEEAGGGGWGKAKTRLIDSGKNSKTHPQPSDS